MGASWSSYRAHGSGLSPSATDEDTKIPKTSDCTLAAETSKTPQPIIIETKPEEPQSTDTSYGVEATAVRTLAASTGTVAILGTTAQTPIVTEYLDDDDDNIDDVFAEVTITPGTDKAAKLSDEQASSYEKQILLPEAQSPQEEPIFAKCQPQTKSIVQSEEEDCVEEKEDPSPDTTEPQFESEAAPNSINSEEIDSQTKDIPQTVIPQLEVEEASPNDDSDEKSLSVSELPDLDKAETREEEKEDVLLSDSPILGNVEGNYEEKNDPEPPQQTILADEKLSPDEIAAINLLDAGIKESQGHVSNDDDDDISSEQLKTNSLSDLSISESMNANLDNIMRKPEQTLAEIQEFLSAEASGHSLLSEIKDNSQQEVLISTSDREGQGEPSTSETLDRIISSESPAPLSFGDNIESGTPQMLPLAVEKETNTTDVEVVTETQDEISDLEKDKEISITKDPLSSNSTNMDSLSMKVPSTESEPTDSIEKDTSDSKVSSSPPDEEALKEESTDSQEHLTDVALAELEFMNAAAVTIQSTFRGYKVRRSLKIKEEEGTDSDPRTLTPPKMTDSMIDIVKEEVEDICKEAEERMEIIISSPTSAGGDDRQDEDFPAPPDEVLAEMNLEDGQDDLNNPESSISSQIPPAPLQDISQADTVTASEEDRSDTDNLPPPDFDVIGNIPDDSEEDKNQDSPTDDELRQLQKPQECAELPHQLGLDVSPSFEPSTEEEAATKVQDLLDKEKEETSAPAIVDVTSLKSSDLEIPTEEYVQSEETKTEHEDPILAESPLPESDQPKPPSPVITGSSENPSEQSSKELTVSEETVIEQAQCEVRDQSSSEKELNEELAGEPSSPIETVTESGENKSNEQEIQAPVADDNASDDTAKQLESGSSPVPEDGKGNELTEAVTTIQAGFRGYQTRKLLRENALSKTSTDTQASGNADSIIIQEANPQDQGNQEVDDENTTGESEVQTSIAELDQVENAAATKIQAGFRGYQVRKERKEYQGEDNKGNFIESEGGEDDCMHDSATKIQAGVRGFLVRQKQKVEREAAVKIQAGYRGFKTRQQMKETQVSQK